MKKFFFVSATLLFFNVVNSQILRSKDGLNGGSSDDTIWHNSGQLNRQKVTNGKVAVHSVPGKYTLYATYKNKKLTGYYAADAKGNKLPVNTVAKQSVNKFKCYTCVRVCNEAGKCAESCTEEPCPEGMGVENANTNERPKAEDPDQGGEIFKKSEKKVRQ